MDNFGNFLKSFPKIPSINFVQNEEKTKQEETLKEERKIFG